VTARVFLDANVLVAAVASPRGGSALIVELAAKKALEPVVSRLVLLEAERNIHKKLPPTALARYHRLLEQTGFLVVPGPTADEIQVYHPVIHEKDAPILAAAVASRAAYLVTLDKHHFFTDTVARAKLPLVIMTPGDFIHRWVAGV